MFGAVSQELNLTFSTWKADVIPLYDVRISVDNMEYLSLCKATACIGSKLTESVYKSCRAV